MESNTATKKGTKIAIVILAILTVISLAFCIFCLVQGASGGEQATLVLYEAPKNITTSSEGLRQSENVSMSVDGNDIFVYETNVNNTHTWVDTFDPALSYAPVSYFDFDGGAVTMSITVNNAEAIENVVVKPLSYEIEPTVEGNVISFEIAEPGNYTVEYNNDVTTAMHIFAYGIDYEAPTASSDDVVYIGPGAWAIESISLESNKTYYISGGAVIQGVLKGDLVENVHVKGHGIIDGSHNESWKIDGTAYIPVDFQSSKNCSVSDVQMLNANAWVLQLYSSSDITVDGVKMISARPNGDGITIQSSHDISVSNCFVRTWDDALVVKNYSSEAGTDSVNITFDNCQIWSDLAQCMEIGYETNKGLKADPVINNINFSNITVLHAFHKPVMSIHNADNAIVSDVTYKNIVVEDASMGHGDSTANYELIDICTNKLGSWASTSKRGVIENITFDGIYVLDGDDEFDRIEGNLAHINIQGYSEESYVKGVSINNLYVRGEAVTSFEDNPSNKMNDFVSDVTFTTSDVADTTAAAE